MTYVEGIGDEVLLFFTFVVASFGILLFLFLREIFRRNNNTLDRGNHTVDAQASLDDSDDLQTNSASYSDFQQRTPTIHSGHFSVTAEENHNATENVTETTRSSEQQCISLRLILQEQTINAQVFYSTTLQELKR